MYPRKGALLPGLSDADLVIWYPPGRLGDWEIRNEALHHNVDYTPYEGMMVCQWPRWTVLRGKVVWDREREGEGKGEGGGVVGVKGQGRFVQRGESTLAGTRGAGEWDIGAF